MNFLYIDVIDFSKPFYGNGQASIAASAVRVLGNRVFFVGPTSGKQKLGRWTTVDINGTTIHYLPVITVEKLKCSRFPSILHSDNLQLAIALNKYSKEIRAINVGHVFTRVFTVLWWMVACRQAWNICFYYPGLGNPFIAGRKPGVGKWLAPIYEIVQGLMLRYTTVAFAAAPQKQVDIYHRFLQRIGTKTKIFSLPTGVNLEIFTPKNMDVARRALNLPLSPIIFTYVGRLASIKGIPFLLNSLEQVLKIFPSSMLLIVGDGEESESLKRLVAEKGLSGHVVFLGLLPPIQVSLAISAANACVVGSFMEGFSNAMIEQIACGKPIVSTNVSGAEEIIKDGQNGFIVNNRCPEQFSKRMIEAIRLENADQISRQIAVDYYSEHAIWNKIKNKWLNL